MAFQRKQTRVVVGKDRVRYSVTVTGDACEPGTHEALVHQYHFVRTIADNFDLLNCGSARFERVSIQHNGTAWEAKAQAEVDEKTE